MGLEGGGVDEDDALAGVGEGIEGIL